MRHEHLLVLSSFLHSTPDWAEAFVGIPGAVQVATGSTPCHGGVSQRCHLPLPECAWNEQQGK